jgi:hypothetical protein
MYSGPAAKASMIISPQLALSLVFFIQPPQQQEPLQGHRAAPFLASIIVIVIPESIISRLSQSVYGPTGLVGES